jgi:Domain of unknown function (DUF6265)
MQIMKQLATGLVLLTLVQAAVPVRAQSSSVTALAWMAGSWTGSDGRVEHEEHWTAPKGGAMVGMHRTIRDGRMVEFEFLRIDAQQGTLVYLSMPGGRSPATPFTVKSLEGERVVFENAAHDFPQRVIYWKEGSDLRARIEGTIAGKERSTEWRWTRSSLAP